jgi:hypothetical protein
MAREGMSLQSTLSKNWGATIVDDSPWLRNAVYDLCFFAFPWVPFLLLVVFGLEWHGDFDWAQNRDNFKLVVSFLFSLNFAHRNYTYVVTYSDKSVFLSRKTLFILSPLLVFASVFTVYYFRHPVFVQLLVTCLALWNLWHNIMQRYGLLRGYAHRLKQGLEQRHHAYLDLALLWSMVLFTLALGALLHLSMAKSYRLAQATVNVLAPFFESYPLPIAVTFGLLLAVLCGWWIYAEWQPAIPFKQHLPRCLFVLSNVSLLTLCLFNPVLGIFAFGFSHSVEYCAYVHAVQKNKVQKQQYQGVIGSFFWNHICFSASLLIGLQILLYYHIADEILKRDILLTTFLTGTAAIHFFYDGIIWKKSKPMNKWVF